MGELWCGIFTKQLIFHWNIEYKSQDGIEYYLETILYRGVHPTMVELNKGNVNETNTLVENCQADSLKKIVV